LGFSYVGCIWDWISGSGTTITTQHPAATIDVDAGDLIVAIGGWEDTVQDPIEDITLSSASNTLVPSNGTWATSITSSGGNFLVMAYKITAANATESFTMTLPDAAPYRGIGIMVFRPDAGDTVTLDANGANTGTGSGTDMQSANINTDYVSDNVIIGGAKWYSMGACTLETIALATADAAVDLISSGSDCEMSMWYKSFTAIDPGDGISAYAKYGGGTVAWVCDILAYKSVAAAGGSTIPRYKKYYDYRRSQ